MSQGLRRFHVGDRLSEMTIYNGTVYLAGQVGKAGDDVATQTQQALAEVDRLLALAGTEKSRILSATIWLADMVDFPKMNAVWDVWASQGNTPARATGEAKLASPEYLVEVIVIAAL